jgi:hypothetical protein
MLKLFLRRSSTKDAKPTVTKPAAAGELAQGELWLNNNHETPGLFARADDDSLIEFKTSPPDATTAVKGIVQLADAAAITAGTAGRVVDAAQLLAANYGTHVHVAETPPANPRQGDEWFHSGKGKLYVYYDDGTGAAQWVVANPQEAVDYSKVYLKTEAYSKAEVYMKTEGDARYWQQTQGQLCKAWVCFTGVGTVVIRSSYNVSSVTDGGVGVYTVNFTAPMIDDAYAAVGCSSNNNSTTNTLMPVTGSKTASSVMLAVGGIASIGGAAQVDPNEAYLSIFR